LINLVDEGLPMVKDLMANDEFTMVSEYLADPVGFKRP
jgi:hypothetical protein